MTCHATLTAATSIGIRVRSVADHQMIFATAIARQRLTPPDGHAFVMKCLLDAHLIPGQYFIEAFAYDVHKRQDLSTSAPTHIRVVGTTASSGAPTSEDGWCFSRRCRRKSCRRNQEASDVMRLSVSAVIPAYNRERFIGDAIRSVLRQERPVDQIVVVDDGSTDGTTEIVNQFPEVELVRLTSNAGTAAARNRGVESARGDVIAWLDSDDTWLPHHVETVVPLLEQNDDAVLAFGLVQLVGTREGVWPTFDVPAGELFDGLRHSFRRTVPPMMAAMTRRRAVNDVNGFDESMRAAVDFSLCLRLAAVGPFIRTEQVTAVYRWHGDQISAQPLRQTQAMYRARRTMLSALRAAGRNSEADTLAGDLLSLLESDLWVAWTRRDIAAVRALVALGEELGGTAKLIAPFRRRQHVPRRAILAWDWMCRREANS